MPKKKTDNDANELMEKVEAELLAMFNEKEKPPDLGRINLIKTAIGFIAMKEKIGEKDWGSDFRDGGDNE